MRRMRDIIRLPVLDEQSGEHLGWVRDILYDEKKCTVNGIILEKDSFLTEHNLYLSRDDITSCAKDNLRVKDLDDKLVTGMTWSQKVGSKVYNVRGDLRGTVGDIYVDNEFRKVIGYEISDGLFADLVDGRGAIFEENIVAEDRGVIIVEGGSVS